MINSSIVARTTALLGFFSVQRESGTDLRLCVVDLANVDVLVRQFLEKRTAFLVIIPSDWIDREIIPYYLIADFERITGVPIIINTSFNVRGEPIVCSPHDAYPCFMRTNMDHLVLVHHLLDKKEQPPLREDVDWRTLYELD